MNVVLVAMEMVVVLATVVTWNFALGKMVFSFQKQINKMT